MDSDMMKSLDQIIGRKRSRTSMELAGVLQQQTGRRVSARTIRRARRALGRHPVHAKVRQSLTERHAALRLAFCREHLNDNLKQWVFADETGFELDSHNQVYWIKRGEARPMEFKLPSRVRINVWAAISWSVRSTLWVATARVTGEQYAAILQEHLLPLLPWGRKKLVQDRATFHRTQAVRDQLSEFKVREMEDFPPCSPDLNIIEHVWSWMKHTVASSHPTNRDELESAIRAAWRHLTQAAIQNFISHVGTVMRQIIAANGWHSD
jgi:transposase